VKVNARMSMTSIMTMGITVVCVPMAAVTKRHGVLDALHDRPITMTVMVIVVTMPIGGSGHSQQLS